MNLTCYLQNNNHDIFEKILPSLITAFIAIIIFGVGKRIDHKLKLKEYKRSWYLKIVVDPNIDKLDVFIGKIYKLYTKAYVELNPTLESNENQELDNIIQKKAEFFGKYDKLIRNLEIELFTIVGVNNPEIAEQLTLVVQEFDHFKSTLDSIKSEDKIETFHEFKFNLYRLKADLLEILYKPINFENEQLDPNKSFEW